MKQKLEQISMSEIPDELEIINEGKRTIFIVSSDKGYDLFRNGKGYNKSNEDFYRIQLSLLETGSHEIDINAPANAQAFSVLEHCQFDNPFSNFMEKYSQKKYPFAHLFVVQYYRSKNESRK